MSTSSLSLRDPPGTVVLENLYADRAEIVLQPAPSSDPNDPLNWSRLRKWWNFFLVCFYAMMVFVMLDIPSVVWALMERDLGYTAEELLASYGTNTAGLAIGCILFIPFGLKFGRRPLYLISIAASVGAVAWSAVERTVVNLYLSSLLMGLAGAIAEALCLMTIADIFFTHQRATANGIYSTVCTIGAFLGPIAAGYSADSQGWRWIWWWCTIFLSLAFLAFFFSYEESKYVPPDTSRGMDQDLALPEYSADGPITGDHTDVKDHSRHSLTEARKHVVQTGAPRKTYLQRLAFATTTPGGFTEISRHIWQPFEVLFTFPGVTYSALLYGSNASWYAVLFNVLSLYMTQPPYNFSSSQIGLMNLPPFIGGIVGAAFAGPFSDYFILKLAKRNQGIFEPEMRLWLALPGILLGPAALILYGISLAHGLPWIAPAMGLALFGCTYGIFADIALTYTMDCYKEITADAFVAIAFTRNALPTIVSNCLSFWLSGMGFQNTFITSACVCAAVFSLTVPMLVFGKKCRRMTEKRYKKLASRQFQATRQ